MKPFLSYWPIHSQVGWEHKGRVTNFDYLESVVRHFKRRKHWDTVSNGGWTKLAPETLILWEE